MFVDRLGDVESRVRDARAISAAGNNDPALGYSVAYPFDVAYAMTFPTGTIMKILLLQVMLAMMGTP